MSNPQLIQAFLAGFRDVDGTPLSGGFVYHYAAGTTTAKDMWTDYTGSLPAAQPIPLDSRGTAVIYGSGLYKIKIVDSEGAQVEVVDNFTAGGLDDYDSATTAATADGQAVWATPVAYTQGANALKVYLNGVRLTNITTGASYTETSPNSITLAPTLANSVRAGSTEMYIEVYASAALPVVPPDSTPLVSNATADGQAVWLTPVYVLGTNTLHVFMNGILLSTGYTETTTTTITLDSTLAAVVRAGSTEMRFEVF